ncbi:MAG TPA: GlsB/YeaQ/YmgE family stress response membrane protein [Gemmataceae bacterium]|nr:GlsB/YeaQ/YmgE family stress response membrane protein [Gemmataceae bacterium]
MDNILWFILIGLIAGWLAGLVVRGRGLGILVNIVVGIVGAIIGGYLFSLLNVSIPVSGFLGSLITATIGAILLLFVLKLVRRDA